MTSDWHHPQINYLVTRNSINALAASSSCVKFSTLICTIPLNPEAITVVVLPELDTDIVELPKVAELPITDMSLKSDDVDTSAGWVLVLGEPPVKKIMY